MIRAVAEHVMPRVLMGAPPVGPRFGTPARRSSSCTEPAAVVAEPSRQRPLVRDPSGTVAVPTSPRSQQQIEENTTPVDDRTRLNLHRKLEAVLGREEADNLMAHLPPVTWNEVATKDDLTTLGTTLRSEMQVGFATLRADFVEGTNRQIKWMVTFAAAWSSLLVTVVRLIP